MNSITNYTLLQEFHSRPAPLPLTFLNEEFDKASFYRDANAQIIDLASKSAQNRRRRNRLCKTKEHQTLTQAPSPAPTTILRQTRKASPSFEQYLFFDNAKIQQVYSEVMMSSEDTPKAKSISVFPGTLFMRTPLKSSAPCSSSSSSRGSSSITTTGITDSSPSPTLKKTTTTQTGLGRRRASRQRPVSRNGALSVLNATAAATASTSSTESGGHRRHRSKVLTQALRKSKEIRQQTAKPVDLSQYNISAAAAAPPPPPPPCPRPVSVTSEEMDDDEDGDWAAFINSGYGRFPLPPTTHLTVSPCKTIDSAKSSDYSASTCASASTSATSNAPSFQQSKTGVDWLDDELAWASSDEEKEELVHSPKGSTYFSRFQNNNNNNYNRHSGSSEIFCTPDSSPHVGFSPLSRPSRTPLNQTRLSTLLSRTEFKNSTFKEKASKKNRKNNGSRSSEELRMLREARLGAFGRVEDRHSSVSSTGSSNASSAMGSECFSTATGSSSSSSRPSSASATSITSSLGSFVSLAETKTSSKTKSPMPAPHCPLPSEPTGVQQSSITPITPTRMTSLEHCVRSSGTLPMQKRPLLGAWLSDKALHSALPSIEAMGDSECCLDDDDGGDDDKEEQVCPKLTSRSSTDLLRVRPDGLQRGRKSSRSSILANCYVGDERPSSRFSIDDRSSVISSSLLLQAPTQASKQQQHQQQQQQQHQQQGTASKFRNRLAAKMNLTVPLRTSYPDAPVTPSSADGFAVDSRRSMSPTSAIFGSAAINTTATVYAAEAASNIAPSRSSFSILPERRRRMSSNDTRINKAGLCFDYDPNSPLYLSSGSTVDSETPISPNTKPTTPPPPPSAFWRRNNAKVHQDASLTLDQDKTGTFPTLRRKSSFRMWK